MNYFTGNHLSHFGASAGAASPITSADEAKKRQITCTGDEFDLLIEHFGRAEIHTGKVSDNRAKAVKHFVWYEDGRNVELPLVFPKPGKDELRLYMGAKQGFAPTAGEIWFIFKKDDDFIYIGHMTQKGWNEIGVAVPAIDTAEVNIEDIAEDIEDAGFQNEVQSALVSERVESTGMRYPRSANISAKRANEENFKCEVNSEHETFISKVSGQQFVEAHHLVPISMQDEFAVGLDVTSNVTILCPSCHRAIHHATDDVKKELILTLYETHKESLVANGITASLSAIYKMYKISE